MKHIMNIEHEEQRATKDNPTTRGQVGRSVQVLSTKRATSSNNEQKSKKHMKTMKFSYLSS
jgi:hypothetical protein